MHHGNENLLIVKHAPANGHAQGEQAHGTPGRELPHLVDTHELNHAAGCHLADHGRSYII